MRAVRLKAHYRANNAGEVCGFPEGEAASLVESGIAEYVVPAPQAAPEVEEPAVAEDPAPARGRKGTR